jgi:peptidyl-dipeptidase A
MIRTSLLCAAAVAAILAGCKPAAPDVAARAEDPKAFVARVNGELFELAREAQAAGWTQATYITPDTQLLNAKVQERVLGYIGKAAAQARTYDKATLDPDTARALKLIELSVSAPAPADAAKRAEFAQVAARLDANYGQAKSCHEVNGQTVCRTAEDLNEILASSRDYETLTRAWVDWHEQARPLRTDYVRLVELANEGARELGYADLGEFWRSGYDREPAAFQAEVDRIWQQVRPLYEEMHCYARTQLAKRYGEDKVPAGKPIPAQLLGNMWAQQWGKIYPDVLQPFPKVSAPNADAQLKAQGYDAQRMVRSAESFYTSLGFQKLPATFWERSMLARPRDREVVCHPSAWPMDYVEDVRIKTCTVPTEEELQVLYHELGHVYYFLAYKDQPFLFQGGANEAFHEAIGDTVVLSMTPQFLQKIGLRKDAQQSRESTLNEQMRLASERIAFLPFGLLVDRWRWQVFSGQVQPADYNKAWWALREQIQGVRAPVARAELDFDAGAKYHVPANSSYTRYFLAFVLQFQFHKSLCEAAGHKGPLNECSIYGSDAAGQKFREMLAVGASRPWPETLEKLTGSREIDGGAIIEYFQPLMEWLKTQNAGQTCGWES